MSEYKEKSVHAYFARPTNLLLGATFVVSLLFVSLILLGHAPSSVTRPQAGLALFSLTALACAVALAFSTPRFGFSARDGLPFLLFPIAMWGAGNDSNGPAVLLAIGIAANIIFWWADGRHDVVEEHHHRSWLKLRWPF